MAHIPNNSGTCSTAKPALTQERLKELLHYDPESGAFTWLSRPASDFSDEAHCKMWNKQNAGNLAGGINTELYVVITVCGTQHKAHRLAWLYVHGEFPRDVIDHINGLRYDNRISNLRDVLVRTNAQNLRTPRKTNKLGILGVHFDKYRNKFAARLNIGGKIKNVGRFDTPELAHAAYIKAKREHHEGCTL
jgi:hypothetical protein